MSAKRTITTYPTEHAIGELNHWVMVIFIIPTFLLRPGSLQANGTIHILRLSVKLWMQFERESSVATTNVTPFYASENITTTTTYYGLHSNLILHAACGDIQHSFNDFHLGFTEV